MTTRLPVASIQGQRGNSKFRTKRVVSNGATTTYTLSELFEYDYVTTSAASMATTLPGTTSGGSIDGQVCAVCFSSAVATATWVAGSGSATIVGGPGAIVANTVYRFVYDHATTSWYPF